MSNPKLNFKEETSAKKTRSPPKKARVEQSTPKKEEAETRCGQGRRKNQHLRFGKAELTPDELSRLSKAQKREMYAANAARTAVHREIDQYEEDNVGVQALSEGEKAAGNVRDISKSRYARKLKRKPRCRARKTPKPQNLLREEPTASQNAGDSGIGTREGGSNWLSDGGRNMTFDRATMPQPGLVAQRRRPLEAKSRIRRCICRTVWCKQE